MAKKNTAIQKADTKQTTNNEVITETKQISDAPKFTKGQILTSKWFSHRRDILKVLLSDDTEYAHSEVDSILTEFMKGKVN